MKDLFKSAAVRLILVTALFGAAAPLRAQLNHVDLFVNTTYKQTGPFPPSQPSGYFFDMDGFFSSGYFTAASVMYPGPGSPQTLNQSTATSRFFQGPVISSVSAFQADYPFGNYTFHFTNTGTNAAQTAIINYTANAYALNIPALDGPSYTGLQGMDPSQPFTVNFNLLTPNFASGVTISQTFTFFTIYDGITGQIVFTQGFIPPPPFGSTSVVIPPNTLQPNQFYGFELIFDEREDGVDTTDTPNIPWQIGFDLRTDGGFNTGLTSAFGSAAFGYVFDGLSNDAVAGWCPCSIGYPVNVATGNLVESAADLTVLGRGRNLQLTRTYNGLMAAAQGSPGRFGFGWLDSYAGRLLLVGGGAIVRMGNGAVVPFTTSGTGFTAPPYVIATLVANNDGTYTFTHPDQRAEIFDSTGLLTELTDRNGYRTTLTRNINGQLTSVTDPAGRTLTFAYYPSGRVASVTDPIGRQTTYTYDSDNNLTNVTDPTGAVTRYAYDSSHRIVMVTDPNGGTVTNTYDSSNRVISQTDPAGRTTTFTYSGARTTITDGNGHSQIQTFNNQRLTSLTRGAGTPQAATWTYSQDSAGNTISGTDPNGHTWHRTYDAHGNQLTFTDGLNRTTTSTYDAQNNLLTRTDASGATLSFIYDTHGNLSQVNGPLGATEKYQHGDATHAGDITFITDPTGNTWTLAYDANGDLIRQTDPTGNVWTASYNGVGWLTSLVTPRGNAPGGTPANFTVKRAYSLRGDVLQSTSQLGNTTSFGYDGNRNLVSITDANGTTTQFTYDADNRQTKITRQDGSVWTTTYDAAGNINGQADGLGKTTSYTYDALNRPVSMTDPLGRKTTYSYDPAGNLIVLTDPGGQTTTSAYDAANELTQISYSDAATPGVTFAYDLNGQRAQMNDGSGRTTFQYDALRRLVSSTDGNGNQVGYQYNLRGDLTGLTYPSGKQVTRGLDAAGRLTSVTDWLGNKTNFSYDPNGNLAATAYPNGVSGALGYDAADQNIHIAYTRSGAGPMLMFDYTRNNLGLVTTVTAAGAPNATYTYTPVNQIQSFNLATFAYDAADNPTHFESSVLSFDAANELVGLSGAASSTTFAYDARGNRIQSTNPARSNSYRYDQANRLIAIGSATTYAYNGDGLRIAKTTGGTPEHFAWDLHGQYPLLLQDASRQFIYGPNGLPLEQIGTDGTVLFFHADQGWSTRGLTDSKGRMVARFDYDAYGQLQGATGQTPMTPLLFAGQYTDSESGLQYMRARYYDATVGEFLTRDPLLILTRHPYLYVQGDPANEFDPTGAGFLSALWKATTAQAAETLSAAWNSPAATFLSSFVINFGTNASPIPLVPTSTSDITDSYNALYEAARNTALKNANIYDPQGTNQAVQGFVNQITNLDNQNIPVGDKVVQLQQILQQNQDIVKMIGTQASCNH